MWWMIPISVKQQNADPKREGKEYDPKDSFCGDGYYVFAE
jgi:hypothetical protein